jgi:hypothetical protein
MNGLTVRLGAAAVAAGCAAILGVAAQLEPAPAGLGTHQQLGLRQCAWLGERGYACPTCGMTTAFALAADGRLGAAFVTQPAAALGAMTAAMIVWIAMWVVWLGEPAMRHVRKLWRPGWYAAGLIVLTGGAWAWKLSIG